MTCGNHRDGDKAGADRHFGLQVFLFFFRPIQRLPLGFHYFWGKVVTWITRDLMRYRRDVVLTNLARSFPEKKYAEIKELARGFYDHLGQIVAETLWIGGCKGRPEKLKKQHLCEITNPEEVSESFENGKGLMLLDAHFGNWELLGGTFAFDYSEKPLSFREEHICVVYKQLKSRFWDLFLKGNRCAPLSDDFAGYTESKAVLRYAASHRHEKKVYLFPTDQFPYKGAGRHEIPSFMAQPTQVMTGAAAIAVKFGLPVWYMSSDRKRKGHYELTFKKITDDASTMEEIAVMEKFYALLEEDIRRNPTNYLWSHKRWK